MAPTVSLPAFVVFTEYGFVEGSGGDGQYRGGLGLAREWCLDAEWGSLSGNFERFRHAPYGINGGKEGSKGRFLHITEEATTELPSKISGVELKQGDRVRLETSGGGGWGDPALRSPKPLPTMIELKLVPHSWPFLNGKLRDSNVRIFQQCVSFVGAN